MGFWNLFTYGVGKALGDSIKEVRREKKHLEQLKTFYSAILWPHF